MNYYPCELSNAPGLQPGQGTKETNNELQTTKTNSYERTKHERIYRYCQSCKGGI